MQTINVSSPNKGTFLLSGELNRSNVNSNWPSSVADIKQAASQQSVVLDLKGITKVDTTGLAWLMNILRDCRSQNIQFTLDNVPETLINLAKISDVEGFLPLQ
ncbi:STAS domain-containing protein [Paraglaciecola sp.]|uniref:STAS domain-containing protein n=1 Tax=Paraglaciecola sp. TaxID=1920173 RepID=UPI0030F470E3